MTEVVAALLLREREGKTEMMICRRPANKARGTLWEFVGGKVEDGETPAEALIRECREELGVCVEVGPLYAAVVHEYPDLSIRLSLFRARIAEGTPRLIEHTDLRWITPAQIRQYAFCPADESILKMIEKEGLPA